MPEYEYDLFLAHAGPDSPIAEELFDLLSSHVRVFLSSRSILLGDDWDLAIPRAQLQSRVTVVMVSCNTLEAYYERDEVRAAIQLARSNAVQHRVVPIFLDEAAQKKDGANYGLKLKQGITLSRDVSLADAAREIVTLIRKLEARDYERIELPARDTRVLQDGPVQDPIVLALRSIHKILKRKGQRRIRFVEAVLVIESELMVDRLRAYSLMQTLVDKRFMNRASGQRVELSIDGLRLITKGD